MAEYAPAFVALLAAILRRDRRMRPPPPKNAVPAAAQKPTRNRATIKAARKQKHRRM